MINMLSARSPARHSKAGNIDPKNARVDILFTVKKHRKSFAGVRNRVLLRQQQERMTQIAYIIGSSINLHRNDPAATVDLIEISAQIASVLGSINDLVESDVSKELSTVDFDDDDIDFFLKNTSLIAAIIESSLYITGFPACLSESGNSSRDSHDAGNHVSELSEAGNDQIKFTNELHGETEVKNEH